MFFSKCGKNHLYFIMNISELRQLTQKKLNVELVQSRRELASVRFHIKTRKEQNTAKVTKLKMKIARIMTITTERDVAIVGAV